MDVSRVLAGLTDQESEYVEYVVAEDVGFIWDDLAQADAQTVEAALGAAHEGIALLLALWNVLNENVDIREYVTLEADEITRDLVRDLTRRGLLLEVAE